MLDTFKKTIELGSKVLYSAGVGANTQYVFGEVVKLYHQKPLEEGESYSPPDRVQIKPIKTNYGYMPKNPIVYASNVVLMPLNLDN